MTTGPHHLLLRCGRPWAEFRPQNLFQTRILLKYTQYKYLLC